MITTARDDMETLLYGCISINDNINISNDKVNDTCEMLIKRTEKVLADAINLEKKIKSLRNAKDLIFTDSFINDENRYKALNTNYSAFADTSNGMLTLKTLYNKRVLNNFVAEIMGSSNGFPGNTHEIYYSTSNIINGNIKFKGESDPKIDLKTILKNDSNSWFEFELFELDEDVAYKTSKIGFTYKENISWISEDGVLKLNIKLYSDIPVKCNFFKITGASKLNSDIPNPILKRVIISDNASQVKNIFVDKELVNDLLINFTTQDVASITLELIQDSGYMTDICRQYALNIDPTRIPYFFNNDYKEYIQLEVPKEMRNSIELLGLKYDSKTSKYKYPSTKNDNSFINDEYIKSKLFYNNKSSDNYKIQTESVKAIRYLIGIKNVDLRYREYSSSGIYVSKEYEVDVPIKTIIFNSDDYIPITYKEYLKENEDFNDFIKYYISLDNGSKWHQINPRHKAHLGPCSIVINSNLIVSKRNRNVIYIDTLSAPYSFCVKIELSRPESIVDEAPIVYEYNVNISSEEEI